MTYFGNGNKLSNDARKSQRAIEAHNISNPEWTRAILRAVAETNTPALIQVLVGVTKYMGGYKSVKDTVEDQMDTMGIKVPVILSLDHGDYNAVIECTNLGHPSVMPGGHKLLVEENCTKTKKIVQLTYSCGIVVEAEVGKAGENQDTSSKEPTDVEDVMAFVAMGVDRLVCGIGSIHGIYPADRLGLDFDRLQEIADAIDVPLVFHGGSGIPREQAQKAISVGIVKANANTESQLAFQDATRKYIEDELGLNKEQKGYDPRKLLFPGTDTVIAKMKDMIEWLGTPTVV